MDQTLHNEQTTTHPSSHGEDEVCEGGRSVYPSDLQMALQKLHVTHSEERDRTEELSDSETSQPVSSRTRRKVNCGGVSREASGHREDVDYEDTGYRDDGVSTECNIVRLAARGDRATVEVRATRVTDSKEEDAVPSRRHLRSKDTLETVGVRCGEGSWPEADSGPSSTGQQ